MWGGATARRELVRDDGWVPPSPGSADMGINSKKGKLSPQPRRQNATLINASKFQMTGHPFLSYSTIPSRISKRIFPGHDFPKPRHLPLNDSETAKASWCKYRDGWTYSLAPRKDQFSGTKRQSPCKNESADWCLIQRTPLLMWLRGEGRKKCCTHPHVAQVFKQECCPDFKPRIKEMLVSRSWHVPGRISDTISLHRWWWLIYQMSS